MIKDKVLKYMETAFGLEENEALELFSSYVDTVNENLAKIRGELKGKNWAEITRAAHSIKGCAMNCGHEEMAAYAKAAEFAGKDQNFDEYETALKEVEKIAVELNGEH